MTTYQSLLIVYAFVGCVYWLWIVIGTVRIVRCVPVLADTASPEPEVWPRLSIIIPACNEEESLEDSVSTVVRQDYPDFEVILIDDRSIDGTGAIVDRMAALDPRVRPIHLTHLPAGWLGKVHALACGAQRADGDWLLFTDADVHMAPDTLRRAVAYCERRGIDHLAAMPDIWHSSLLLDAIMALFLRVFSVATRCWAIDDPRSGAFIGVGAFNLVRRDALRRTEGFEWLRLEVADDVGLGLMLKRSGARSCLVNAMGLVGLHWYRSLAEMARGVEKAYASAAQCSLLRMIALCITVIALEGAPLVMLLPLGIPALLLPGLLMAAAAVASIIVSCRATRRSLLPGFLFPLAVVVAVGLLLRSAWLGTWRGGVVWRGTLYPRGMLRAGCRVRLPG